MAITIKTRPPGIRQLSWRRSLGALAAVVVVTGGILMVLNETADGGVRASTSNTAASAVDPFLAEIGEGEAVLPALEQGALAPGYDREYWPAPSAHERLNSLEFTVGTTAGLVAPAAPGAAFAVDPYLAEIGEGEAVLRTLEPGALAPGYERDYWPGLGSDELPMALGPTGPDGFTRWLEGS